MAANKMTWLDAIVKVLRDEGAPLDYNVITEKILEQGLRGNPGATPASTVAAQISLDRNTGSTSTFVRVAKGVFGLREWGDVGGPADTKPGDDPDLVAPSTIAVQAYGIYWERAAVDWSKTVPRLDCQQFGTSDAVDMSEQRGIYVLFDHRAVVYVGRATDQGLGTRLRQHTWDRLRSRWDRFSWFGFHTVGNDGKLQAPTGAQLGLDGIISVLEAVLIELAEPPQNRQQGKGLSGSEYLQRTDPALEKQSNAQLLSALAGALERGGR